MPKTPQRRPGSRARRRTMTLPEFAAAVGASRSYVYALAKAGRLPVPLIRVGGKLLVSRAAVERLLGGTAAGRPGGNGAT